ncbi:MAG: class I SAM-dependent methyltransferase [Haliea sp.]|nr:class I SAM-dependent methyltransferase [Haliea sp.]
MKSTHYYDDHAEALCSQYNAVEAGVVHGRWKLPDKPGFACDIGAGSGRDANWLASLGWDVVAVEPSAEMRKVAMATSHPNVTWLDDALPHLNKLRSLGHRFDLILLSAVWMHVPPTKRERAFRILSELLKPSGVLVISLRHGVDQRENAERGFYEVSAGELMGYAQRMPISATCHSRSPDLSRSHVYWQTVVFLKLS